ncbi:hypothetical protein M9978_08160 [Sphingomonas sp. MG17]|uniref:Uncharacterized protein n=1 Tax=Sphingomonas tagetis TaxID=2949092 RepID=A0A9X2HKL8_9SPHN|nr:hypothetical protein [Sphingomonas tagetis]MCP3730401.1 hypothetical protein [Sphingomonas tagetis]
MGDQDVTPNLIARREAVAKLREHFARVADRHINLRLCRELFPDHQKGAFSMASHLADDLRNVPDSEIDAILAALESHSPTRDDGGEVGDVMIGEFIARWEDAADGVMMDADTAEALAREFKRMRSLIYCPGVLRCAKCDFRLTKTTLTPVGAFANEEPDSCPNCNVPMWRTTWQDEARDAYKTAESQMDRAIDAEGKLAALDTQPQAPSEESAREVLARHFGVSDDGILTPIIRAMLEFATPPQPVSKTPESEQVAGGGEATP